MTVIENTQYCTVHFFCMAFQFVLIYSLLYVGYWWQETRQDVVLWQPNET